MTVTDLRYFEAVCVYKSISRAAEFLHISQPSLSVAIKGLEEEFGIVLLERRHRGVVLTAEGEELYKRAKDLLRGFDELEERMHDLGNKRLSLRIGVPPMIGSLILPHLCSEFKAEHPNIHLDITEAGSQDLSRLLMDGDLDMIFLPHRDSPLAEFSTVGISRLGVVCCTSSEDELAKRERVSPLDLADRRLVLFSNSFFQTELIKRQFAECGVEPDIILQTDQLSTVESVVESGVAVGFLFGELIERRSGLALIPLENDISVAVSLAYKRGAYMSDGMKAMREYAKRLSMLTQRRKSDG